MSGRKVAGCCVHVACLIYYLSHAKYNTIKEPAEHLNSIFVGMSQRNLPNEPKYIRKRRNSSFIETEQSNSISSDSDLYISDICSDSELINEEHQNKCEISEKKNRKNRQKKSINKKTCKKIPRKSHIANEAADKSNKVNETTQMSMSIEEIIARFKPHVPFWGGKINYRGNVVNVTNTCTIDNLLFAFWVASQIEISFMEHIPLLNQTETIKSIVSNINCLKWDEAKELWINNIIKYDKNIKDKTISLYGSESNRFISHISEYQNHILIQLCNSDCNLNKNVIIQDNCTKIYFKKIKGKVVKYSGFKGKCDNCRGNISCDILFENKPNFIYVESINSNILLSELTKLISIGGISYRFLCSTIHKNEHFFSVFEINNNLFKIDDLDQSFIHIDHKTKRNNIMKETTSVNFYCMI
jgi:hypothetical protein